ncbi:MAG TPA: hypothetical protein VFB38_00060 [Chthonomonadaceae bacterium]|nr:hypothetical protein [Chthonomonadaceae bacterium]
MAQPWCDPVWFGTWYGSLVGGLGGTLAGILGAVAGTLAPQGKGKRLVLGGMRAFIVFGALSLLIGIIALIAGQPYGIWYPLTLVGVIFVAVMGSLQPMIHRVYRQAEARKLEAESLRNS